MEPTPPSPPSAHRSPEGHDPRLWNEDLAPTRPEQRTWNRWHIAALWVGMAVCIPTYTLAAGLLSQGLSWWGAVLVILLGNLIVLVPMVLNAHPGARYGIPFPVLARASFGLRGANVPAVLRALVACGWFGIQTWFGGLALYQLGVALAPGLADAPWLGGFLGINLGQLIAFLLFWALQMYFVVRGMESIKFFESWSAPVLIVMGLALLIWALAAGGGPGRVLDHAAELGRPAVTVVSGEPAVATFSAIEVDGQRRATEVRWTRGHVKVVDTAWAPLGETLALGPLPADAPLSFQFRGPTAEQGTTIVQARAQAPGGAGPGFLFGVLLPALTAMVGYWATLSLNIPDFTRFAKSQREQLAGQAIGLPPTMALYSFIGIAVTAASVIIYQDVLVAGDAPWDPVSLIGRMGNPVVVAIAMFALSVATLTTNIAANVVSPANDFANLAPKHISFKTGGIITGVVGIVIMPWKLLESLGDYIFTWLIGYSALLGPIGGIMIADYFVRRRRHLVVDDLYREGGVYERWNWRSIIILIVAVLPNVPGFLAAAGVVPKADVPGVFHQMYTYAWFSGFVIAFGLYCAFGGPRVTAPAARPSA
ncbi:MAG: NCS1 family nucleobase:cation symporter-1 [Deltaproteobacteria bacterium]|nr:NCS1 family nucleobase:cation symporter-1 [Deltaproteobacteria bacterium]